MFADLHLHTRCSDGTFTPSELAREARKAGLSAIALTDHDTVEGCGEAAEACAEEGLEFVAGSELTAEHEGREVHLLGYSLDTRNATLLARMAVFQSARQERIRKMSGLLHDIDVPLRPESVFQLASCRSPGRPHVARALVAGGFCSSLDEAFERYLKKGRPAWVPKFKLSAMEAISLIHQAGGLAVFAHPGLTRADSLLPVLVDSGLDGLECFHTKHSTAMAGRYLEIAKKFGLLVTGGSDCHGMSKGKPLIGKVLLPMKHFDRLMTRARRKGLTPSQPRASRTATLTETRN